MRASNRPSPLALRSALPWYLGARSGVVPDLPWPPWATRRLRHEPGVPRDRRAWLGAERPRVAQHGPRRSPQCPLIDRHDDYWTRRRSSPLRSSPTSWPTFSTRQWVTAAPASSLVANRSSSRRYTSLVAVTPGGWPQGARSSISRRAP